MYVLKEPTSFALDTDSDSFLSILIVLFNAILIFNLTSSILLKESTYLAIAEFTLKLHTIGLGENAQTIVFTIGKLPLKLALRLDRTLELVERGKGI